MRSKRILAFAAVVLAILAFTSCKFISDMIVAKDLATNIQEVADDILANPQKYIEDERWEVTLGTDAHVVLKEGETFEKTDSTGKTFLYTHFDYTCSMGNTTIKVVFEYKGKSHTAEIEATGGSRTAVIDGSRYDL